MRAEGDLIADRYRLRQVLGRGAMGEVWRAVDEYLGRTVAVKLLSLNPADGDEMTERARQRAMREGRIAKRLQHPNAIAVHDVAEHEGWPVLVMEHLPSQSLAAVLTERGVLQPLTVAGIGAQVAAALTAAHAAGIVHRDVKPGNILLGEDGTAKITDFGISWAVGEVAVTENGIISGTPAYLSPEIVTGADPTSAADVFSLAATLYAAIEGTPPFGVDDAFTVLHRIAGGRIEPPRDAGTMTDVLVRMLKQDPADRPTMAEAQGLILQATVAESLATAGSHAVSTPVPQTTPPQDAPQKSDGAEVVAPTSAADPSPRDSDSTKGTARPAQSSRDTMVATAADAAPSTDLTELVQVAGRRARSRRRRAVLASAAAFIVILGGLAVTGQATQQPPTIVESQVTKEPSRQQIESVVRQYYSLTPENLGQAFQLLGPNSRRQGEDAFKSSWTNYADSRIVGPLQISGNTVDLTLDYTLSSGAHVFTRATLGIVRSGEGRLLINIDREVRA